MPIEVKCNKCGKALKAPDTMAGKKAKCPTCGNVLVVPQAEVFDAEVVEPEPSLPPVPDLGNLLDDELAYRVAEPDPTPAARAEESRRPCPACGEMIAFSAAKCRFCGEIFDASLKKKARKKASGDDDDLTGGELALAILCSTIGCIVGIVWAIQGKPKGGKMIGISIVASVIWNIIGFLIQMAAER